MFNQKRTHRLMHLAPPPKDQQAMRGDCAAGGRWLKPEPEPIKLSYGGGGEDGRRSRGPNRCYDEELSPFATSYGRQRLHGGGGRDSASSHHQMKLSSELSKESLRRPGAVPFLWEQTPGKRKSPPPRTLRQLFRRSTDAADATAAAAAQISAAADLVDDDSDTCSFTSANDEDDARSFASGSETAAAGDASAYRSFLLHRFLPAANAVASPSAPHENRRSAAPPPPQGSACSPRLTISDALACPEEEAASVSDDEDEANSGSCSAGFVALRLFRCRNSNVVGGGGGVAAAVVARLSSCAAFSSRRRHHYRHALRQIEHYRDSHQKPSFPSLHFSEPAPIQSPDSNTSDGAISSTIKQFLRNDDLLLPPVSSSLADSPSTSSRRSSVSSNSYSSPKLLLEIDHRGIKLKQGSQAAADQHQQLLLKINQAINANQEIRAVQISSSQQLVTKINLASDANQEIRPEQLIGGSLGADMNSDQGRAINRTKSAYLSSTSSSSSSRSSCGGTNYGSINTGISSPNYSNWSSMSNVNSVAGAGEEAEEEDSRNGSVNRKLAAEMAKGAVPSPPPPPLPRSPTQSWLMQSLISGKSAAIRSPSRLAQMQRAAPPQSPLSAHIAIADLQRQSSRWMNDTHLLQRFPEELLQEANTLKIGA